MNLRIIIFDVEHGFCAFVRSPTGHSMLIDCGRSEYFSPAEYVNEYELSSCVKNNGFRLTRLVVSHPHDDHIQDIGYVSQKLRPCMLRRQQYDWNELETSNADYRNLETYVEWQKMYNSPVLKQPDWGMTIYCSPYLIPKDASSLSIPKNYVNNSSIVVFVEYMGVKFTFPGDLQVEGWYALLRDTVFCNHLSGTTFFITSHHGHSSGYVPEIFEVMGTPVVNIVSARSGDDNIEPAYSKPENALGIMLSGESQPRRMLSTRSDGHMIIEVNEAGQWYIKCVK